MPTLEGFFGQKHHQWRAMNYKKLKDPINHFPSNMFINGGLLLDYLTVHSLFAAFRAEECNL